MIDFFDDTFEKLALNGKVVEIIAQKPKVTQCQSLMWSYQKSCLPTFQMFDIPKLFVSDLDLVCKSFWECVQNAHCAYFCQIETFVKNI